MNGGLLIKAVKSTGNTCSTLKRFLSSRANRVRKNGRPPIWCSSWGQELSNGTPTLTVGSLDRPTLSYKRQI